MARRIRPEKLADGETRRSMLMQAKRSACDCRAWFLWRLNSGGGLHGYRCEAAPTVATPAREIKIIHVARAPLTVLRATQST